MTSTRLPGVALLILTYCAAASSCPVCYGAADSPMNAGMNTAILVMLGITGFVLASIVGCFFLLWRRAKRHQAILSPSLSVNEHGMLQEKNEKGVVEWNNF